jgi:hypothetical protein
MPAVAADTPDIRVANYGSVVLMRPVTAAGPGSLTTAASPDSGEAAMMLRWLASPYRRRALTTVPAKNVV